MSFSDVLTNIGNVFSTLFNPIGSIANVWSTVEGFKENKRINDLNYNLQVDNLAYQKDLQKLMFRREDNAVQRRVSDLRKAGLSPTLAAGSSAGAGPVISTVAPQKLSNLNGYLALAQVGTMIANQQKAQTEADIARQQLKQTQLDTKYLKDRGLSPLEVNQDWKTRLVNLIYPKLEDWLFGEDTKGGAVEEAVKALANGKKNPDYGKPKVSGSTTSIPYKFPYEIARAVRSNGEKLNDRQYEVLKKTKLYNTWVKEGFANRKVRETLARYGR